MDEGCALDETEWIVGTTKLFSPSAGIQHELEEISIESPGCCLATGWTSSSKVGSFPLMQGSELIAFKDETVIVESFSTSIQPSLAVGLEVFTSAEDGRVAVSPFSPSLLPLPVGFVADDEKAVVALAVLASFNARDK